MRNLPPFYLRCATTIDRANSARAITLFGVYIHKAKLKRIPSSPLFPVKPSSKQKYSLSRLFRWAVLLPSRRREHRFVLSTGMLLVNLESSHLQYVAILLDCACYLLCSINSPDCHSAEHSAVGDQLGSPNRILARSLGWRWSGHHPRTRLFPCTAHSICSSRLYIPIVLGCDVFQFLTFSTSTCTTCSYWTRHCLVLSPVKWDLGRNNQRKHITK